MRNRAVTSRCDREDWIRLTGRLLPAKGESEDGDKDEDEDPPEVSDPEFLDAEEMEGGAVQIPSYSPHNTRVKILTEDSREYIVTGFFPLIDPWWSVTVYVKSGSSHYFAKGFPSYELKDDILGEQPILSLFLKECGVHDEFKSTFLDWVKNYPPVTFSRLMCLAEDFQKKHDKNIMSYLTNSELYNFVLNALKTPQVLKYLPKLLPHKMRGLPMMYSNKSMSDSNTPPELMFQLEDLLCTEPWKLGFGLLLYRQLKLCGCEATLDGFRQCEDLLKKIPKPKQNALFIYNKLKEKCMEMGDTYVEQSALTKATSKQMTEEDAWNAILFLKEQEVVKVDQERVFLYNYFFYEVDTAKYITGLLRKKQVKENEILGDGHTSKENNVFPSSVVGQALALKFSDEQFNKLQINDCATEENPSTKLDAEQRRAARMILANPVTIISGKGGCGKTTVVSLVFKAVMQQEQDEIEEAIKALEDDIDASDEWDFNPMTSTCGHSDPIRILLTAPTGKAASLLRKKTELPSATLHQITCSYSAWKNQQRKKKEKGEEHTFPWKFSKVEALVVDEGSLVSVRIFSAVMKLLCTHAKLAKLVILGDIRQLPSIEPGNLLADIFTTFKGMNWAIELKTNHRAESQLIVDNATRISNQEDICFDAELYFRGNVSTKMPSEEKKCILVTVDDESVVFFQTLPKVIKEQTSTRSKGKQSCHFLHRDHRNRYDFRCGDKVCCTKNAYVKDLQTSSRLQCADRNNKDPMTQSLASCIDDERICNGEIFYITDDVEKDKIRELTLSDGEERSYTLNYKALRSRSGLGYAWARTIHTFQGSEEDTVVYVLGTAGRQNWKHVYTAVTRGRKRVYIIAMRHQLARAITNRSRERKTRLQQRLKDKLSQSGAWPQPSTSASTNPVIIQETQDKPGLGSQENPNTPLKTPPRFRSFTLPTTPEMTPSKKDCADEDYFASPTMPSPSGSLMNHETHRMEESPSQKRAAIPVDGMETPSKQQRLHNSLNLADISPASKLHNLSLHGSCTKKLFDP
uniref:DNA helicase B n=1 Tax=Pyxicephalus adspersus TaxID=30357 RepID=A0AAV3AI45_PYXAD|nr:TPA: hypothetical protein GDO54_007002 [Pyxicephalus adspersus]